MEKLIKSRDEINRAIDLALLLSELRQMAANGYKLGPQRTFSNSGIINTKRLNRAIELCERADG